MRKTFLARRNALLSEQHVSFGGVMLAVVLVIVLVRISVPDFFWWAVSPLTSFGNTLTGDTKAFFDGFTATQAIVAENVALAHENTILAGKNRTLMQKLSDITALLGAREPARASGILAGVATRPPESPYDTLVVAAGTKQGVAIGMEAFADQGVPVGVVTGVNQDFSQVTLFSAPGAVTRGWVGASSTPVAITGSGGGAFSASVPRAAGIGVGDVVSVPGPGRQPIGIVARVDGDLLAPSVTLRIVPATNPFSLAWIVLRPAGTVPMTFATSTTP